MVILQDTVLGSMGHPTFLYSLFKRAHEHTSTSEYDHYTVPRLRSTFHWSGRGSQLLAGEGGTGTHTTPSLSDSPRVSHAPSHPLHPTPIVHPVVCLILIYLPWGALIRNLRRARGHKFVPLHPFSCPCSAQKKNIEFRLNK